MHRNLVGCLPSRQSYRGGKEEEGERKRGGLRKREDLTKSKTSLYTSYFIGEKEEKEGEKKKKGGG